MRRSPAPARGKKKVKRTPNARRVRPKKVTPSEKASIGIASKAASEALLQALQAAPAPKLIGSERKSLRAKAHHLTPLVQVGHAGVTDAIITATSRALLDHELIKVRLHEPEDKKAMADELATRTLSALCGLVGHTVILYKPNPQQPNIRP